MNNRAAQPHAFVIGAMAIVAAIATTSPGRADTDGATGPAATISQPETRTATVTTAPRVSLASSSLPPHAVSGGS